MTRITFGHGVFVYALGFWLTASWVIANPDPTEFCTPSPTHSCDRAIQVGAGIYVAGFGWPLYWTIKIMETIRK